MFMRSSQLRKSRRDRLSPISIDAWYERQTSDAWILNIGDDPSNAREIAIPKSQIQNVIKRNIDPRNNKTIYTLVIPYWLAEREELLDSLRLTPHVTARLYSVEDRKILQKLSSDLFELYNISSKIPDGRLASNMDIDRKYSEFERGRGLVSNDTIETMKYVNRDEYRIHQIKEILYKLSEMAEQEKNRRVPYLGIGQIRSYFDSAQTLMTELLTLHKSRIANKH